MYEMISGCYDGGQDVNITVDISYSEADGKTMLNLTSGGKEFNPFENEDDDVHLGIMMLKRDINFYQKICPKRQLIRL